MWLWEKRAEERESEGESEAREGRGRRLLALIRTPKRQAGGGTAAWPSSFCRGGRKKKIEKKGKFSDNPLDFFIITKFFYIVTLSILFGRLNTSKNSTKIHVCLYLQEKASCIFMWIYRDIYLENKIGECF